MCRYSVVVLPLFITTSLLLGCSTPSWTSPPGSERFQIGYRDGCDGGYAVAGSPFYKRIKAAAPLSDDSDYVDGWNVGYFKCLRSYNRIQGNKHTFFGAGS